MTLTLSDARTVVRDHLDDDGTRWSDAQVDRALQWSLSQCLNDYVGGGGERFDSLLETTTDATGLKSLSAENPMVLRGVSLKVGNRYYPLRAASLDERNRDDQVARTIQIRYVKTYALPTTATHPLVGSGATAAGSWDAFDHWICLRAAQFCTTKDAENRSELHFLEQSMASSIMTVPKIPYGLPFPGPTRLYGQLIKWVWKPETKALQLASTV